MGIDEMMKYECKEHFMQYTKALQWNVKKLRWVSLGWPLFGVCGI